MGRRKIAWWFGALAGPAIMFGLSAVWATMGLWPAFVSAALTGVVFLFSIRLNLWNWRAGYMRGMDDFAEAAIRSSSEEEFLRLTLQTRPPRPWE